MTTEGTVAAPSCHTFDAQETEDVRAGKLDWVHKRLVADTANIAVCLLWVYKKPYKTLYFVT